MSRKQCRICCNPDNDDLISVQLVQEQVTIAEMILAIAGVKVTSDRRLPQNICLVCMERLTVAYQFRQQCIAADVRLREELQPATKNYLTQKHVGETTHYFGDTDEGQSCEKQSIVEILELSEERLDDEPSNYDLTGNESSTLERNEGLKQYIQYDLMESFPSMQEGVHYVTEEAQCFPCCGCNLNFNSEYDLKVHSLRFHRKPRYRSKFHPLQCNVCYQTFDGRKNLETHQTEEKSRRKTSSTMFRCLSCFALLMDKTLLFGHLEQHKLQWQIGCESDDSLTNHGHEEVDIIEEMKTDLNDGPLPTVENIRIEIQNNSLDGDDQNSKVSKIESDADGEDTSEEKYSIEIDLHEESSMEEDETDENDEEENTETLEKHSQIEDEQNKVVVTDAQGSRAHKVMCSIPEDNLRVVVEEEGYFIVELVQQRCCCCAAFFKTSEKLENHLLKKRQAAANSPNSGSSSPKYLCEYCGKQFKYSVLYVAHNRVREQQQFYMCRLCNRLLESESRMKSHMLHTEEHANFYKLSRENITDRYETLELQAERCCCCWQYFDSHEEMLQHFHVTHEQEARSKRKKKSKLPFACALCNRRFRKHEQMEQHLQQRRNVLQHFCKLCDFQTRSSRRIELHLYSSIHRDVMHGVSLKPLEKKTATLGRLRYCCFSKCGQHFREIQDLHNHSREAHEDELKANKEHALGLIGLIEGEPFECDVCGQLFKNATALKNHQSLLVQQDCVCSICGIKKRSRAVLLAHERSHTGERPYGCDFCDKTFSSSTTRNSHLKCHIPRKYECGTCSKMFARKENLKRHIRLRHSEATYQCEGCPKKFKTRETLVTHMRSHTGEKPYKCRTESCDKWYVNIGDRRRHEMAVHTLERPHKCSYCNSAFIRKRQLVIHERRHTGDKPFACAICGKRFYERAHLTKHSCTGSTSMT